MTTTTPTRVAVAAEAEAAGITIATTGLDNADPVLYQTVQAVQIFQLVTCAS